MNPAMVLVWIFGLALAWRGDWWQAGWWQVKFSLVVGLTSGPPPLWPLRKEFEADRTPGLLGMTLWNEVSSLMIAIVFLVGSEVVLALYGVTL